MCGKNPQPGSFSMQRVAYIFLASVLLLCNPVKSQDKPYMIHSVEMPSGQQPIAYEFLRESDVVWYTELWKAIDLREAFNQYIYFPIEQNDISGKKSLAYVIWEAVERDEIPIYEDDALQIPIDTRFFIERYTKADTVQLEIGYDDDDNEIYQTVVTQKHFDGADIVQYSLREAWFIGKQDSRQDSRRLALAPMKDIFMTLKSSREELYMGRAALFWIPMQHPAVRRLLAKSTAYIDDNNIANQPSWDNIFIGQLYSAYVTKESNLHDRDVDQYLTGKDALIEAALIEKKVYEIGDNMWEY